MQRVLFLLILIGSLSAQAFMDANVETDKERLDGFFEFKEDQKIFDRERDKGQVAHDEEIEKWIRNNERSRKEFILNKEQPDSKAAIANYHEWLRDKEIEIREAKKVERNYSLDKKVNKKEFKRPVTEVTELDIYNKRPRYEHRKRVLFGAKSSFKSLNSGSSSSGFGGSSGGNAMGSRPSGSDEFGDPGYVAPPVIPDMGMDSGMGDFSQAPSSPPPPPGFEEGDFPPPPPPPPGFEDGDTF